MAPKKPANPPDPAPGRFAYDGLERTFHEKARLGILTSLVAHPKVSEAAVVGFPSTTPRRFRTTTGACKRTAAAVLALLVPAASPREKTFL